jgi:two-component system, response regulator
MYDGVAMTSEAEPSFCGIGAPAMKPASGAMRKVLIVACTDDDARSVHEMLLGLGVENPIEILPHANDLLSHLTHEGSLIRVAEHLMPALILLDVSNRRENGFGLLRWLQCHGGTAGIPIAVLTAKTGWDQAKRAYQLGVRTFLRKPLSPTEFRLMVDALKIPLVYSLPVESRLFDPGTAGRISKLNFRGNEKPQDSYKAGLRAKQPA